VIVDSSALVAMLAGEPKGDECLRALSKATSRAMSAAAWHETCLVIDRRGDPVISRRLNAFRLEAGIHLVPFTATQADIARRANQDFGKGSGSSASLNFGDCMSYALAIDEQQPLLFIGNDFIHTDVRSVLRDPTV
jgi:ribonuclease VapC